MDAVKKNWLSFHLLTDVLLHQGCPDAHDDLGNGIGIDIGIGAIRDLLKSPMTPS